MLWDEDNRISEIDDIGQRCKYTYDDKGVRVNCAAWIMRYEIATRWKTSRPGILCPDAGSGTKETSAVEVEAVLVASP